MFFLFSLKDSSSVISYRAGPIVRNYRCFCLSGNVFLSPPFFEETVLLDENSWLTGFFCFVLFFLFGTLNHLLISWFLMRNYLLILLRILCIWQVATPLLLSGFSFIFWQFIMMWLCVGIFESILFGYC